jgi:hypothetical protein
MTKEELKQHCEKQVECCETWARNNGGKPHGKIYEEHKLILDLINALEQHEVCVKKLQKIEQIVNKWNNDASHSFSDMCKINGIIKQGQKK